MRFAILALAALPLAACNSSSGTSTATTTPTTTPTTPTTPTLTGSFANGATTPVALGGNVRSNSYGPADFDASNNANGVGSFNADNVTNPPTPNFLPDDYAESITLSFDASGNVSGATVTSTAGFGPGVTVTGTTFAGADTLGAAAGFSGISKGTNTAADSLVLVSNPGSLGHSHQTFAAWMSGQGTANGNAGAGSFGNDTAAADVPTTGNATYNGKVVGHYFDNTPRNTLADVTLTADFAANTVAFATTNTQLISQRTNFIENATSLDMTGALTISANEFAGTVNTTGSVSNAASPLSGNAVGGFYGTGTAAAAEAGGTFYVQNNGNTTGPTIVYYGAFGAAQ